MPDDPQEIKVPEKETQDSAIPTEEQKTSQVSEEQSAVEPEGQQTAEPQKETEAEIPDKKQEYNKAEFEKLREKFREEKARRLYAENVTRVQPPQPAPVIPLYDPETGILNEQAMNELNRRSIEATERARRAEQAVQNIAIQQEEKETFAVHPELDPSSKKFDKALHRTTRAILQDAMYFPEDYGGKSLSFLEAAGLAKSVHKDKDINAAKVEGAKEAIEQLTPKEQAALEATGAPQRRTGTSNLDDLRRRTRKGDIEAIVERLNNLKG